VKAGVLVPWWVAGFDHAMAVEVATTAEALGYDVVWFADHLAVPEVETAKLRRTWYDAPTLMAHVAAHTSTIRLGTNVLVAPYRHPVLSAKMLATVDAVSGGRLIVGVGSGFVPEEFAALGAADHFEDRGAYTEECIAVWKVIWKGGTASFSGRYVEFHHMVVDPPTVQRPHPPIWIGNLGDRVLRRVAAMGDGWHPVGLRVGDLHAGVARLRALWAEHQREGTPVISYGGNPGAITVLPVPEEGRALLAGGVEQVRGDLEQLAAVPCHNVAFRLGERGPDDTLPRFLAQLDLLATVVRP
jgi:probable F420-dependent oxidoreductase